MLLKSIFLLLLIIGSFPLAKLNANECKDKDQIIPIADHSNYLGPIREPDQIGWCYAYAATDLLEYRLRKDGKIPNTPTENILSQTASSLYYNSDRRRIASSEYLNSWKKYLDKKEKRADIKKLQNKLNQLEEQLNEIDKKYAIDKVPLSIEESEDITNQITNTKLSLKAKKKLLMPFSAYGLKKLEDGGFSSVTINQILENGYCTQKELPAEMNEYIASFSTFKHIYQELKKDLKKDLTPTCDSDLVKDIQIVFPGFTYGDILTLIKTLKEASHPVDIVSEMLAKTCKGKIAKDSFETRNTYFPKDMKWSEKENIILKNISEGPIAISLNGNVVQIDKNFNGNTIQYNDIYTFGANHETVIAGAKFNCKYNTHYLKVRDNSGKDYCDNNFGFRAANDLNQIKIKHCKKTCEADECKKCDELPSYSKTPAFYCDKNNTGYHYIRSDYLLETADGITTLNKK